MSKQYKKHLKNYTIYLEQILREDSYSKVYSCRNNETGEKVIVRVYPSQTVNSNELVKKSFYLQIYIMKMLKTENILRFLDVLESEHNFYIFMEHSDGGTLKETIQKYGKLEEKKVLAYLKEILNVFEQMNTKHIIHGNIRPENLFVKGQELKIGFFGNILTIGKHSKNYSKEQISYSAPEILASKRYNNKCDIWSLGVTLYEVLFGHLPWNFNEKNLQGILHQIEIEQITFPKQIDISKQMQDFINDRISWPQVFLHPIFDQKKKEIEGKKQIPFLWESFPIKQADVLQEKSSNQCTQQNSTDQNQSNKKQQPKQMLQETCTVEKKSYQRNEDD